MYSVVAVLKLYDYAIISHNNIVVLISDPTPVFGW